MRFSRLYLSVLIFFISFSTSIFADEIEENMIDNITVSAQENIEKVTTDKDYNDERIMLENKKKALEKEIAILSYKGPRINFFYLLGRAGYVRHNKSRGFMDVNLNPVKANYMHGFAVSAIGGWQARKYFAMEVGIGYVQADFMSIDAKYTLLFQPYFEMNKSWSIMPKIGLGVSLIGMFSEVIKTNFPAQGGLGFDAYGTIGAKAIYKNIIFGVSYEYNFIGSINDFMLSAEAGIKF